MGWLGLKVVGLGWVMYNGTMSISECRCTLYYYFSLSMYLNLVPNIRPGPAQSLDPASCKPELTLA